MSRILSSAAFLVLAFAVCGFAQQVVYFPQVANGMENGTLTHWHTTIFVDNQSGAIASGAISLINSDGTAMLAQFVDENGRAAALNGQISFELGQGESHKYTSTAANALFSHYSNAGPEFLIAEAGVPPTAPMLRQAIFVDTQFGFNEGIAIVNTSNAVQTLTLQLVGADGTVVRSKNQILGPQGHFAKFLSELFPDVVSIVGRLQVFGNAPVASVALRFNENLTVFTTLFPFAAP